MYIQIWGKKIYYEIYGEEQCKALLYLHGGPGASCLDFVNQAKALGKKLKVVIFDQLGVLRSDAIAENEAYSMEYQIEMCEEMRKGLGIEKWSVLGHSFGGMLAVLYAYRYPESIEKVILECPSLYFQDSARSVARYLSEYIEGLNNPAASTLCEKIKVTDYNNNEVAFDLIALLGYVTDQKLRNYLHGISYKEYMQSMDTNGITKEMWSKAERHLLKLFEEKPASPGAEAVTGDSCEDSAAITDNFLPMAQKVKAPVLLIDGKYDPACTENLAGYMRENVRDMTHVIFENSGHFPRIEEADRYTHVVLEFIYREQ